MYISNTCVQMICERKYFQRENCSKSYPDKRVTRFEAARPFHHLKIMIFHMEKTGQILTDSNFYSEVRKFREDLEV